MLTNLHHGKLCLVTILLNKKIAIAIWSDFEDALLLHYCSLQTVCKMVSPNGVSELCVVPQLILFFNSFSHLVFEMIYLCMKLVSVKLQWTPFLTTCDVRKRQVMFLQ